MRVIGGNSDGANVKAVSPQTVVAQQHNGTNGNYTDTSSNKAGVAGSNPAGGTTAGGTTAGGTTSDQRI